MADTIRWMIRRDISEVMDIENSSFDIPWTEDEFLSVLRQHDYHGLVAERADRIVGFLVYAMRKGSYHIVNFAVTKSARRTKVGYGLTQKLIDKLCRSGRSAIDLEVSEKNLAAQCFFRSLGFRSNGVLHGHYEHTGDDAYAMRYALPVEKPTPFTPYNRITGYDALGGT